MEVRAAVAAIDDCAVSASDEPIGPADEMERSRPLDRQGRYEEAIIRVGEVARLHARRAQAFRYLALHDPLTGLWNRRAFDDRVAELAAGTAAHPFAILMLDVDHFRGINEVHGHEGGDRALEQIAARITHGLRPSDFASRLGGDEFAILLPSTRLAEATLVAERLRSDVERITDPAMTVSIGVREFGVDIRSTILAADTELYAAKRGGRNAVRAAA